MPASHLSLRTHCVGSCVHSISAGADRPPYLAPDDAALPVSTVRRVGLEYQQQRQSEGNHPAFAAQRRRSDVRLQLAVGGLHLAARISAVGNTQEEPQEGMSLRFRTPTVRSTPRGSKPPADSKLRRNDASCSFVGAPAGATPPCCPSAAIPSAPSRQAAPLARARPPPHHPATPPSRHPPHIARPPCPWLGACNSTAYRPPVRHCRTLLRRFPPHPTPCTALAPRRLCSITVPPLCPRDVRCLRPPCLLASDTWTAVRDPSYMQAYGLCSGGRAPAIADH